MKIIKILLVMIYLCGGELLAQWIQISYPPGGQITSIISKENNLFVSNTSQGVYLSTDNGDSWSAVNSGISTTNIQDLLVKENFIYAGTYNGGVFLSSDNGSSWVAVNNGLTNLKVYALTLSSSNIIAGTESGGVFISSDNGMNWSFSGLTGEVIWDLCSDANYTLAATAFNNIFLSTDDGNSWQAINNGLPSGGILAVEIHETKFFSGTPYNGPYLSTDYGANWFLINNGISAPDIWSFEFFGSNIFLNCSEGVYLSTDLGSSWTNVSDGLSDLWILSLFIKDDYIFAGSGNSGILYRRPISELVSEIKYEEELPEDFILYQNYPNPFNPITKIGFRISDFGFVSLKVFDVLGNEVATLVDEYKPAGKYEVEFLATGLPSEIYFYKLSAGSFSQTKKMILLK